MAGLSGDCGGTVIGLYTRGLSYAGPVRLAEVDVVLDTVDPEHVRDLLRRLSDAGFPTRLLSSTSG